jgi:outer membrane protein TolC
MMKHTPGGNEMVVPATSIPRQELRTTDGQVYAYIMPADELHRLQTEVATLREQVTKLQKQKERCEADLKRVLKSSIPLPPTEEEIREAAANPNGLGNLIAELEARQVSK